jgi:hypothetical protein
MTRFGMENSKLGSYGVVLDNLEARVRILVTLEII